MEAESAGFSDPFFGIEVGFEGFVGDGEHSEFGDGDLDGASIVWDVPEADPGVDGVDATAEEVEHIAGVFAVFGFSEDVSHAFGHGIASEDDSFGDFASDIGPFLEGEAGDHFGRRFAGADTAFGIGIGDHDLDGVTGLFEQLSAAGGLAGEDERWFGERGHRVEGREVMF